MTHLMFGLLLLKGLLGFSIVICGFDLVLKILLLTDESFIRENIHEDRFFNKTAHRAMFLGVLVGLYIFLNGC